MKQIVYILLLLPSLLWGQSAAREELTDVEQLERAFARPSLTRPQLEAFSLKGEEKLRDFCEFTQVLADTTYPAAMLDHIATMALSNFSSEQAMILGIGASGFFTALRNAATQPIMLDPESLDWKQSFIEGKNQNQIAVLAFRDQRGKAYRVRLSLRYELKQFGTDRQYVWTVLLDSIELI